MINGVVKSAAECRPIPGVLVTALDAAGAALASMTTDIMGEWEFFNSSGIARLHFTKAGFGSKDLSRDNLLPCVRLLEDRLIGYHNKLWFFPGDRAQVFVHSVAPYQAQLFRHGLRKECVLNLGERSAQRRDVPNSPWVANGLPWSASWGYTLPADLRPGLYSLGLKSTDDAFAIPLVVATPAAQRGKRSPLLVLASTLTWQAYNFHGGRSKYVCWEDEVIPIPPFTPSFRYHLVQRVKDILLPDPIRNWLRRRRCPSEPWRNQRLSVRRPFTHSGMEADDPFEPFTNHLAGAEWRLLAWLEREGLEYDFCPSEVLHACPDLLSNYKTVILSTHCEYISKEMFASLQRFHTAQGGWLLNLSGNSLYCEVEVLQDAMRFVGGLFMDSCADETQLLGVRFTRNDIGTCAPYRIVQPKHWAFAGIPLPQDHCFGRGSLNRETPRSSQAMDPSRPGESPVVFGLGASGWETDKLSGTAPRDIAVIAKGMNQFGGADMVVREPAESRGGMFSASSITFAGSLLIDDVASQIVKNVIQRAIPGVQELQTEKPQKRAA